METVTNAHATFTVINTGITYDDAYDDKTGRAMSPPTDESGDIKDTPCGPVPSTLIRGAVKSKSDVRVKFYCDKKYWIRGPHKHDYLTCTISQYQVIEMYVHYVSGGGTWVETLSVWPATP